MLGLRGTGKADEIVRPSLKAAKVVAERYYGGNLEDYRRQDPVRLSNQVGLVDWIATGELGAVASTWCQKPRYQLSLL